MTGLRAVSGWRGDHQLIVQPVTRDSTALDLVRHALAKGVTQLDASVPVARIGADPEGVHQARVATRRIRSGLSTFAPLLDGEWTLALRAELQWLGTELGAVRDLDVLRGHLADIATEMDPADRPGLDPAFAALDAQWADARTALERVLQSARFHSLHDDLTAAAHAPVVTAAALGPADSVIPPLVRRTWKRLDREVGRLPHDPADEQLHAVRIRAKRARYAAEAVVDAFGKPAKHFAKAMGRVQDTLGMHNDMIVTQDWLRVQAARGGDASAAFTLGRAAECARRDAHDARLRFPEVWEASSAKRLRRWF